MTQKILHIQFVLESEMYNYLKEKAEMPKLRITQIHMHCELLSRGFYLLIYY